MKELTHRICIDLKQKLGLSKKYFQKKNSKNVRIYLVKRQQRWREGVIKSKKWADVVNRWPLSMPAFGKLGRVELTQQLVIYYKICVKKLKIFEVIKQNPII